VCVHVHICVYVYMVLMSAHAMLHARIPRTAFTSRASAAVTAPSPELQRRSESSLLWLSSSNPSGTLHASPQHSAHAESTHRQIHTPRTHNLRGGGGGGGAPPCTQPPRAKLCGHGRLNKIKKNVLGGDENKDEHNLAMGFDHLINELKGLMGTEGFSGNDAKQAMDAANNVNSGIREGDDVEELAQSEAKLLGSRRLYKLVRKSPVTASRERKRRDHPGETIGESFHGR